MVVTTIAVTVIAAGKAATISSPTPIKNRIAVGPVSAGWGYFPSGGLGLVLTIVVVLMPVGRI